MNKIASRIRRTIAVAAAAAAVLSVGLPATSADASVGSMTANLRVTPVEGQPGYQWVHVYGQVNMTRAEAQDLINRHYNVVIRLWGDDPSSDDLLMGPYTPVVSAEYFGLHYSVAHKVPNSLLNEDWGEDDLYAGVRLVQPNTVTLRSAESNRVWGYF
jgi:hypothetical protein